jgi:hypothetical protein
MPQYSNIYTSKLLDLAFITYKRADYIFDDSKTIAAANLESLAMTAALEAEPQTWSSFLVFLYPTMENRDKQEFLLGSYIPGGQDEPAVTLMRWRREILCDTIYSQLVQLLNLFKSKTVEKPITFILHASTKEFTGALENEKAMNLINEVAAENQIMLQLICDHEIPIQEMLWIDAKIKKNEGANVTSCPRLSRDS